MINDRENTRLTRVGPDTPGGALLRRYWHPLIPAQWITADQPSIAIKILGESLVVFQSPDGAYHAVAERCPHRGASLRYGFVEQQGIRCSYHGWLFNRSGHCIEMPFEPHKLASRVSIASYPVVQHAGLLFSYLGPDDGPSTPFPYWDILAREDGEFTIQLQRDLDCNWLQMQENAADVTHTTFLHSYRFQQLGIPDRSGFNRPMKQYGFQPFEWGLLKSWVYEDEHGRDQEGWGNILVFPNMLRLETEMHWKVPIDDRSTRVVILGFRPTTNIKEKSVKIVKLPETRTEQEVYPLDTFYSQDAMACETAGDIYDRTAEILGASDTGISMFRSMLRSQIDRVEVGLVPSIGRPRDSSVVDLREWMSGYLPMSAPRDPTISRRRPRSEIFDERHRSFLVPQGKAREVW